MAIPLWSASSDLPSQDEREKSLSASKARIHDLHAKVTTVGAQPPVQRHKQTQRWSLCCRMTIQETDMPNFCQLSKRQTVQQCSIEQTGGKEKIKHPRGEAYHGTVFPLCHHITLSCRMLPTPQLLCATEQELLLFFLSFFWGYLVWFEFKRVFVSFCKMSACAWESCFEWWQCGCIFFYIVSQNLNFIYTQASAFNWVYRDKEN